MPSGFQGANIGDVTRPFRDLVTRVHEARAEANTALALALVRETKLELSKPGTGRRYKRGVFTKGGARARTKLGRLRFRYHVASEKGQPPAVDSGTLRNSIAYEPDAPGSAAMRVGTNVAYAPYLEPPGALDRPFFRTALERVKSAFPFLVPQIIRRRVER